MFRNIRDRVSSWLWAIIILAAIVLAVGIPIALVYGLSHIEGLASVIFLVIGWFVFGIFAKGYVKSTLALGSVVGFFALMGMAIDQAGNYLFNLPIGMNCPEGSTFARSVVALHPYPGRTVFEQAFRCYDGAGKAVKTFADPVVFGVRFAEYFALAYMILGMRKLLFRIGEARRAREPRSLVP